MRCVCLGRQVRGGIAGCAGRTAGKWQVRGGGGEAAGARRGRGDGKIDAGRASGKRQGTPIDTKRSMGISNFSISMPQHQKCLRFDGLFNANHGLRAAWQGRCADGRTGGDVVGSLYIYVHMYIHIYIYIYTWKYACIYI